MAHHRHEASRFPRRLDVLGEIVDRSRTVAARPASSPAEMRAVMLSAAARLERETSALALGAGDLHSARRRAIDLAAAAISCRTALRGASPRLRAPMDELGDVLSGISSVTAAGWTDAAAPLARWESLLRAELRSALGARSHTGLANVTTLCAELVLWLDAERRAAPAALAG